MENEGMLELVSKGMNLVFNDPKSPFLTETAWNIMFGGFLLNCESNEFEGQAVCGAIQNELEGGLEAINDTHFSYSLFRGVCKNDFISCIGKQYFFRAMGPVLVASKSNVV